MPASRKSKKRFGVIAVVAVLLAALVGGVLLQYSLDNSAVAHSNNSVSAGGHSLLDVFGGVRQTLAAFMWNKGHTVFHQYLGEDPKQDIVMYPYYWLITKLDPHFEEAYFYASYMLCHFGLVKEGYALALEGVRNNPDSAELQRNLAEIYFFFKKDPRKAKYHIEKAIALSTDDADKVIYGKLYALIAYVLNGTMPLPAPGTVDFLKRIDVDAAHQKNEGTKTP